MIFAGHSSASIIEPGELEQIQFLLGTCQFLCKQWWHEHGGFASLSNTRAVVIAYAMNNSDLRLHLLPSDKRITKT